MADQERTPKVLIVDDDPRLRDLLRRYLGENGFSVSVADGAPAMNRIWTRHLTSRCSFESKGQSSARCLAVMSSHISTSGPVCTGSNTKICMEEPWAMAEPQQPAAQAEIKS